MRADTAFALFLGARDSRASGDKRRPRGYKAALETMVSEAVRLSSGQETGFAISFVRPSISYMAFDPMSMDGWFDIDPEGSADFEGALRRAEGNGLKVVPYFYNGYCTGEDGAAMVADPQGPIEDLLLALHEKRHSSRKSGGLDHTRLGKGYFERKPDRSGASGISEAGQIQEAACDCSAAYDLQVLAYAAQDPGLRADLIEVSKENTRASGRTRRIIERRREALLSGNEEEARIAIARFGAELTQGDRSRRLYESLERALRAGADAVRIKERIRSADYPQAELAPYDVEDLLAVRMLHYADYVNEAVESKVRLLQREFSPSPRKVAQGEAKNPFIDLIGLHSSVQELDETLSGLAYARRRGESRLKEELRRETLRFSRGRLSSENRYSSLRRMYALSQAAEEKGICIAESISPLASRAIPREVSFDARRFLYLHPAGPQGK